MISCTRCGADNRDEARFCKNCGAPLLSSDLPAAFAADLSASKEGELPAVSGAGEQDGESLDLAQAPPTPLPLDDAVQMPEMGLSSANPESPAVGEAINRDSAGVETDLTADERLSNAQDLPVPQALSGEAVQSATASIPVLTLPAVIAGRYELTEVIEQTDALVIYRAYDRLRCWQCGTLRAELTDLYCEDCGAEIGAGASCRIQVGSVPSDAPGEQLLPEGNAIYWIMPEPVGSPALAVAEGKKGLCLHVGYASNTGQVREIDEDSLLVVTGIEIVEGVAQPSLGLFAVADGMGGHDNGQVASRRVIQVLAELLLSRLLAPALSGERILPEALEEQVRDAIAEANRRLTLEARKDKSDMGSTLTLALVRDAQAVIANVGDSRTYLWRNGVLKQVTEDHSMVARLLAQGMIGKDEIYTHPHRNEIYRMMGDKPKVEVDVFQQELQPGDWLVLCCDGVWETIRDDGIEEVLLAYPDNPQAVCEEIVRRANLAGAEDNISVIMVEIHGHMP